MTYSTIGHVKKALHLDAEDIEYDDELADAIDSADGMIDALAASRGLIIPTPVPKPIRDASRYIAAYLFKNPPRAPSTDRPVFMQLGLQFFESWVATFHVGKMASEDSST